MAERIAAEEGASLATVRGAVLLHDVGRARAQVEGLDHADLGARIARQVRARGACREGGGEQSGKCQGDKDSPIRLGKCISQDLIF